MWKNSTARYGSLQVALHWLMLVLLVAVYAAMELRENFPKGSDPREFMKSLHFMLGISVLILVTVRIAARFSGPTPAIVPQPPSWQELLGKLLHLAMYAFMIGMPIAGWLILSAEAKPIPFFGLELPALVAKNKPLAESVEHWHKDIGEWGYYLVGLHAAAALFHHYVRKDNTLVRMLPWGRKAG